MFTGTAGWCKGSQQPRDGIGPCLGEKDPAEAPPPGAILGVTSGEVLHSSRLVRRQAVFPQHGWEDTKGDMALWGVTG